VIIRYYLYTKTPRSAIFHKLESNYLNKRAACLTVPIGNQTTALCIAIDARLSGDVTLYEKNLRLQIIITIM